MKIAIANDHIALGLKLHIAGYLREKGYEVEDLGTDSPERTDYPLFAKKCAEAVTKKRADLGILICGTGVGMSIAANKRHGIRAVCCSEAYSAKMARQHNDANILCFGARVIGEATAEEICDAFLEAGYEGGRHQRRVDMIAEAEREG